MRGHVVGGLLDELGREGLRVVEARVDDEGAVGHCLGRFEPLENLVLADEATCRTSS